MPAYSKLLLAHLPDKVYAGFLDGLIEKNFYRDHDGKISIKQISTDFNSTPLKITQWLKSIYEDIFDFNFEHPEYFQKDGIKVCLYFNYFDSHCGIYASLPAVPREFESVDFLFVKAKVGCDRFWVKKVQHEIAEDVVVTVWLEGESLKRYREMMLEKALFQGHIGFMDKYKKHGFELDDMLKKLYRN